MAEENVNKMPRDTQPRNRSLQEILNSDPIYDNAAGLYLQLSRKSNYSNYDAENLYNILTRLGKEQENSDLRTLSEPYLNALGLAISQGNISQDSVGYAVKNILPLFIKPYVNRLREAMKSVNPEDEKNLLRMLIINKDSFPSAYKNLKASGMNLSNLENYALMIGNLPQRMDKDPVGILMDYYNSKAQEFVSFYVNKRNKSPDEAKKIVDSFSTAYKNLLGTLSKDILQKLAETVYKSHIDAFENSINTITPGIIGSAVSNIPDDELLLMTNVMKQQYSKSTSS